MGDSGCGCMAPMLCDSNGICVDCLSDAQCPGHHCETRTTNINYGICVDCVDNAECNPGQLCDNTTDTCLTDCRLDGGAAACQALQFVCDPATGQCVACVSNQDCQTDGGSATPFCDTTVNNCVQCLTAVNCPYSTPGCSMGNCGSCQMNLDCPSGLTCQTTLGMCTCTSQNQCAGNAPSCVGLDAGPGMCGCASTADCRDAGVCDDVHFPSGACVPSCAVDGGAANCQSMQEVCNPSSGLCVGCLSNQDCQIDGGMQPFCDTTAGVCVQCLAAADCPYSSPGCSDGTCGLCQMPTDCPAGLTCDTTQFTCDCTGPNQCAGNAPACVGLDSGTGTCGCYSSADCGDAGVCDNVNVLSGACVPSCVADAGLCSAIFGSVCNAATGVCGPCSTDNQCAAVAFGDAGTGNPFCVVDGGTCVQCISPSQCPIQQPGCDSTLNICNSCSAPTDCPAGYTCDMNASLCRAPCSAGCPAWQPFCTPDAGTCSQCLASAGCDGGTSCDPTTLTCK
jgi:hypothetical protein